MSKLKDELKELNRLYIQEKKNHKQNNILYNEQIERLETKLMDFRKQNNQLLIQLSQLSNEIIDLRKKNTLCENKIKALEYMKKNKGDMKDDNKGGEMELKEEEDFIDGSQEEDDFDSRDDDYVFSKIDELSYDC